MTISKKEEKRYIELQIIALNNARIGKKDELRKMIEHGININLSTHKDDTLLMLSAYNGNYETTKMLINKGANIEKVNQRGQTPLEGVAFKGYLNIVKLLVQNGANINKNSIIYASIFGNKEIVKYLQSQNLKKNSSKIFGITVKILTSITTFFKSLKQKISRKKNETI